MNTCLLLKKILEKTDVPYAPWTIIEANDRNFAVLKIMITVTHAIKTHIEKVTRTPGQQTIKYLDMATVNLPALNGSTLEKTDLSKKSFSERIQGIKKAFSA
nr:hypothetical protein [Methanosarcina horonobensis]